MQVFTDWSGIAAIIDKQHPVSMVIVIIANSILRFTGAVASYHRPTFLAD